MSFSGRRFLERHRRGGFLEGSRRTRHRLKAAENIEFVQMIGIAISKRQDSLRGDPARFTRTGSSSARLTPETAFPHEPFHGRRTFATKEKARSGKLRA